MKKTKKTKGIAKILIKNPVAKFAFQFNKALVYRDKSKYQRKAKHNAKEPFPMVMFASIGKGSCFLAN